MNTAEWMLKNRINKWILKNETLLQAILQQSIWTPTHYCPECSTKYKLNQSDIDEAEGFIYCDYHDIALLEIE